MSANSAFDAKVASWTAAGSPGLRRRVVSLVKPVRVERVERRDIVRIPITSLRPGHVVVDNWNETLGTVAEVRPANPFGVVAYRVQGSALWRHWAPWHSHGDAKGTIRVRKV